MNRRSIGQLPATLIALALCATAGIADDTTRGENPATESTTERVSEEPMRKVGEARLKVLLWSIYDTRLYTPSGSYDDGDRPLRLEIQYLRDIDGDELVDRTLDEWQAMGRDHPHQAQWVATLRTLWPDIKASDVLTFELDRNSIATFLHNGQVLGQLDDPDFGQQFIDIWLSMDCTRPALRAGLLGEA